MSEVETIQGMTPTNTGLNVGDVIGGCVIQEVLGAGGMAIVLKVLNLLTDRIEAVKVILPAEQNNPDFVARFRREIRIQSALNHPNIASLHTAAQDGGRVLMFLEYVDGMTLRERLKDGPLPLADCVEYTLQILDALSYAHARGVIHRDIKPDNVMITSGNAVKLMDFGIACSAGGWSLTRTGIVVGSLQYLSPEQFRGSVDCRSDVFATGILLCELLTGRPPFLKLVDDNLVRLREFGSGVPADLRDIVRKAIENEPEERFQSADEFRAALVAVKARLPVCPPAVPAALKDKAGPARRLIQNPILRMSAGGALMCLIALGIVRDEQGQKRQRDFRGPAPMPTQAVRHTRRAADPPSPVVSTTPALASGFAPGVGPGFRSGSATNPAARSQCHGSDTTAAPV